MIFGALASIAGKLLATKVGTAVATTAASAAIGAINQKAQNKAAQTAYNKMLAEQEAERNRIAIQNDLDRKYQAKIDEQNRITAKADAANKFVDMNAAAQKAGLNPLTVLRATGGSGFGAYGGYGAVLQGSVVQPTIQAPILSNQSVAQQIGLGALQGFIDFKANQRMNEHYDRLNELDLEQRKIDIKLGNAQLDQLATSDPYRKFGDTIPVRVGNNTQQLDVTVARRMGILPNDRITAGDLEEIRGEIHGSIQGAVESDIGGAILPRTPGGNTPVGTPWMDSFVGKITNIINKMPNTPIVPPLSDKRWNDEWRNYVN
jgi:hypothetical protein